MDKIPLIHILHSGQLYGTERMTINIALALGHKHLSIILSPEGAILKEAVERGIATQGFKNYLSLVRHLNSYLAQHQKLIFMTTSVSQSILVLLCNLFYSRQIIHLHIVHGGTEDRLSYARKSLLNNLPVKLIAVSSYVRERLKAHGVNHQKLEVIENFLLTSEIEKIPKRQLFTNSGITKVIIVSRLDPIKRIDLLFDALDYCPQLNSLKFCIFGFGTDMERLKAKAKAKYPQIELKGFSEKVFEAMAASDLLLHLCPVEPFGLAILEAMAIGLPVLVPDRGGTKSLVENGKSGFQFNANDHRDLAVCLLQLRQASPQLLNSVVYNARETLQNKYLEVKRIDAYCKLANFD